MNLKILGASKRTFKYLGLTLLAILIGWILAGVFVALIAFILDSVSFTMSWYANPWIIFGLYSFPTVGITSLSLVVFNSYSQQVKYFLVVLFAI